MLEILDTLLRVALILILAGYTFYYRNSLMLVILVLAAIGLPTRDAAVEPWYAEIASSTVAGLVTLVLIQYMRLHKHNTDLFHRAQLGSIIDSSNDAIVGVDLEGKVFSWNKAAERLYGWTEKEMRAQSYLDRVTAKSKSTAHDPEKVLKRIAGGENVPPYVAVRKRKDGSYVNVYVTMSPIRMFPTNEIIGASAIVRPIGENYE